MAGTYVLPQVRVFQEFARTPNDVTQNLNPFLIGPNYQLMRYAHADERGDCEHKPYPGKDASNALLIPWAAGLAESEVDKDWGSVTMVDGYAKLSVEMTGASLGESGQSSTKFEFELGEGKSLTGDDLDSNLIAAVKPGDYLCYTDGNKKKFTRIREISCGTLSEARDEIYHTVMQGKNQSSAFTVNTENYTGEKSVEVRITKTDGQFKWQSKTPGLTDTQPGNYASGPLTLGLGLQVTPATGADAPEANTTYVIKVTLAESYSRDTVTVSDFVPSTVHNFTFARHFDAADVVADDIFPSGDAGMGVMINARVDIGLDVACEVIEAEAYLNQRNLRTDHSDGVYSLRSDAEIFRELGSYETPDNPLAYAAHIMLLNSANTAVRYIGLPSNDAEGYAEALERASVTTDVYAFCPLTEDHAILESVVADCNRMSSEENKSWRIAFFSEPTPEEIDVVSTFSGTRPKCKIADSGATLTCDDVDFLDLVREDDTVTVIVNSVPHVSKVASVTANNTLTLTTAIPGTAVDTLYSFRITHRRGRAELVAAIAATSERFKDRRAYNVFPNGLTASDGNYVSGMFAAAAVCALTCSVAPQQPITNVELKGFADIPDTYSKFSRDELNTIAAGGTLIVMQDKRGGPVYVRHQISTAYSDGNLNSTELSLVKNLDSISYYFANRFAPYIGRYNVSDDLLADLRNILEDGLSHLESTTESDRLVGPQVLADGTEVRALYRDPNEHDKVYANVALNLPAPFNNFDLHLQVI